MGTLFLVATPIGNRADISPRAVETLGSVDLIAAEDTRHTGRLLQHLGIERPLLSYHALNQRARRDRLLAALSDGDVALVSDAGSPGISDPGFDIVTAAIDAGYPVSPVPGPSSIIAAVSASGLVEGPFLYQGFLPRKGGDRRRAIARAGLTGAPVVVFEAANRLVRTLGDLREALPARQIAVARELTKLHEEIRRGTYDELMRRFESEPARGEIVIVVGPSVSVEEAADDDDVAALVQTLLQGGMSPSEAAREASSISGMSRSEAYRLTQGLVRRPGEDHTLSKRKG
ncbi:MAG: 16S rRNA (cytidine(1402)-2'-O)-methyltransferase [Thermomicrobiales bacterium]